MKQSIFKFKVYVFFVLCALFVFQARLALGVESDDIGEASADIAAVRSEPRTANEGTPLRTERLASVQIINASGKASFDYRVKVDSCVIVDGVEREVARIFYTSYELKDGNRERPVTFFFNGGPGAASVFLQMGMFGPQGVTLENKGLEIPRSPFKVQDNPDCLIDVTDMVFVDPVGTGFSLASLKKDERGKDIRDSKPFWGVQEDLDSLGQFIRVWLSQNKRWGAPVLLCGESYGGLRVAGLAASLIREENIVPDGVILISPVISYAELMPDSSNWNPYLHALPVVASTARYHGKLGKEFDAMTLFEYRDHVRKWAEDVYMPALSRGYLLDPASKELILAELSRFTGIPQADILKDSLLFGIDLFVDRVLSYDKIDVSRYDTRLTMPYSNQGYHYSEDPTNVLTGPSFITAWRRYLEEDLGLYTDRNYVLISEEANQNWNFMSGTELRVMGYPSTVAALAEAMRKLPEMKLFVASGLYDAVTPLESVLFSLARLDIPRERRMKNITTQSYEGGHMFYTNSAERKRFADDLRLFMQKR